VYEVDAASALLEERPVNSPEPPTASDDEACVYAVLWIAKDRHDRVAREVVAPLVRELCAPGDRAQWDSFFFVRYNQPRWQLRFRLLGRRAWMDNVARPALARALELAREDEWIDGLDFGEYEREWERYGGPEGMRLAEKIFLADSLAALEVLEAEARGTLGIPRREYSLVHTERFLDLLGFDRQTRVAFYRTGHAWAIEDGHWTPEDLRKLDARYDALRSGLLARFRPGSDAEMAFGDREACRISQACLRATGPAVDRVRAAHAEGRVHQDLVYLAWSYCHMHCNRLGIENPAEAILRYFMYRFYEDPRLEEV
jgi:thiopeptide-type bacteriocin biosynthesis protein